MSHIATYLKIGKEYQPIPAAETAATLPPAVYTVHYDPRKEQFAFTQMDVTHDELIDLPGTAYEQVMADLEYFLTQECVDRFAYVKLLHKMNILLYGVPGGGKTCIVNRVALKVIETGGIVLFNPDPRAIKHIFNVLDHLQPDTRVLVIFEELDQLISQFSEAPFLHVLDGEIQKHNAMFIATTNFIGKIPARIKRPGRFPVRLEVGLPNLEARRYYVNLKLNDLALAEEIAQKTEGFTIDQLKDVIRQHYCMKKDLDPVLKFLRSEFGIIGGQSAGSVDDSAGSDEDWEECDADEGEIPAADENKGSLLLAANIGK